MRRLVALLTVLASVCFASGCVSSADDDGPIKLGYAASSPIATILAASHRDAWTEQGLSVSLEAVNDVGLSTSLLAGKQVHFAHSAPTTAFTAVGQGAPVRIIAGLAFGLGDNQAGYLTAPAYTGIRTLADLAGRKVATTGIGTSYDFYLRAQLSKVGLSEDDVQLVPVSYPQMRGALATKQVDAAVLLAVDYAKLRAQEPVNLLATSAELAGAPIEYSSCIVARTDWLSTHRAEAVDFLAGLLTAEQWLSRDIATNDGRGVRALLQPVLKYDQSTMDTYYQYRLSDIGREPTLTNLLGMPRAFVDPAIATLESGGGLEPDSPVTYENAVDLSYLREAYQKVGLTWSAETTYQ